MQRDKGNKMAQFNPTQYGPEILDPGWKSLCRVGGVAALIFLVYSLVTMILLLAIGGQPQTAAEGFKMLHDNRVVGLLRLDALTTLAMPLYYLLFLGLYAALRKTDGAYTLLAAALAFAGVTLFLATPAAFSLLALSDRFAVATTDAEKAQLLAAGEAILASDMWHGSGAMMGSLLLQTGTLLVSVVMLWGKTFGKLTAYVGIATHGLDLAHGLVGFLFPTGGVILMAIAGPLYLVWFPLLARDFFRLGRD
jgi:hypothetical protein